jgi:murein DD-endopeptidase MepM/ murein hydrolase activator NlpD
MYRVWASTIRSKLALVGAAALLLGACARATPAPVVYRDLGPSKPLVRQEVFVIAPIPAEKPMRPLARVETPPPTLPAPVARAPAREHAEISVAPVPQPASMGSETRPGAHRVVPGDTIYSIAKRYGIQARELVAANSLPAPYDIHIGQELRLPTHARAPEPQAEPPPTQLASLSNSVPMPASKPVYWRPLAPPPPRGEGLFAWPVRGHLLSVFGGKPGGLRNDGINIAATEGTAVRAAEAGVVAYVGNELRGFGNLVLVRHSDGWMSAYAHVGEIVVDRGDTVARGQVIARVGRTGRIDQPQLHFELRKGSEPVDPMRYLPPATSASNDAVNRDARLDGLPGPG